MSNEIPAVATPCTPEQVRDALAAVWPSQLGGPAPHDSVRILCSQWALETGEGRAMKCFNIGNVKQPSDTHLWCQFPTFEYVKGPDGKPRRITLRPPDPGCHFRAFRSLEDGVADYLHGMWSRWTKAWHGVVIGDPVTFAQGLHDQGYYTAPVDQYVAGVERYFDKYVGDEWDADPAAPDLHELCAIAFALPDPVQEDPVAA